MKSMGATQEEYYRGVRMVPYDLIKELAWATAGVAVVAVLLSIFLSSPDVPPVTIATWSQTDPVDFVTTATGELAGTTGSAGYGQPYNSTPDANQHWGPIAPQAWFGVRIPVDSANAFVIEPLKRATFGNTALATSLTKWQAATSDQQAKWLDAYTTALADATVADGKVAVKDGDYGPLPVMMSNLLGVAQTGGLDGLLVINGRFYQTDYTQPLLFMGDSGYLDGLATAANLTGDRWGVMNETGQYPGPDLAVAFQHVVPGAAIHKRHRLPRAERRQRRPRDHPLDDAPHGPARAGAIHPDPARHPTVGADPPPDLAQLLQTNQPRSKAPPHT